MTTLQSAATAPTYATSSHLLSNEQVEHFSSALKTVPGVETNLNISIRKGDVLPGHAASLETKSTKSTSAPDPVNMIPLELKYALKLELNKVARIIAEERLVDVWSKDADGNYLQVIRQEPLGYRGNGSPADMAVFIEFHLDWLAMRPGAEDHYIDIITAIRKCNDWFTRSAPTFVKNEDGQLERLADTARALRESGRDLPATPSMIVRRLRNDGVVGINLGKIANWVNYGWLEAVDPAETGATKRLYRPSDAIEIYVRIETKKLRSWKLVNEAAMV